MPSAQAPQHLVTRGRSSRTQQVSWLVTASLGLWSLVVLTLLWCLVVLVSNHIYLAQIHNRFVASTQRFYFKHSSGAVADAAAEELHITVTDVLITRGNDSSNIRDSSTSYRTSIKQLTFTDTTAQGPAEEHMRHASDAMAAAHLATSTAWQQQQRQREHADGFGRNDNSDVRESSKMTSAQQSSTASPLVQQPTAHGCGTKVAGRMAGVPKVALLFLVHGEIPTEPIWRAFLEMAARLSPKQQPLPPQQQPANPAAAIAAAALHGKPMHPALQELPDAMYPGFRIQHGLAPGFKALPPGKGTRLARQLSGDGWGHGAVLSMLLRWSGELWRCLTGSGAAGGSLGAYPGAFKWEQAAIAAEHARLLSGGGRGGSGSSGGSGGSGGCGGRSVLHASVPAVPQPGGMAGGARGVAASQHQPLYRSQRLFSVYVHASPGYRFPASSIFAGRELPQLVNTTNGYAQHALVEAEMLLLREALKDTTNTKFVLLSDSSIPIYPPTVVYAQLMAESKSRIDGCKAPGKDVQLSRFRPIMTTSHFNASHWRKSSQWFILSRPHASLAVADRHVREIFHRYCYSNLTRSAPLCVSDEHYLPSLLASYGLDNETDCQGLGHYADWNQPGWHPRSLSTADVASGRLPQLLRSSGTHGWRDVPVGLRRRGRQSGSSCDAEAAIRSATLVFHVAPAARPGSSMATFHEPRAAAVAAHAAKQIVDGRSTSRSRRTGSDGLAAAQKSEPGDAAGDWAVQQGYQRLGHDCALFARKFPAAVVDDTLGMALSCAGLGLGSWCTQRGGSDQKGGAR